MAKDTKQAEQAAAEQEKTTGGLTPEEKAAALKSLNQKLLGTKK